MNTATELPSPPQEGAFLTRFAPGAGDQPALLPLLTSVPLSLHPLPSPFFAAS